MICRMIPYEDSINDCGLNRLFIFTPEFVNSCIHLIAMPTIIQFELSLFLHHLIIDLEHLLSQGYLQLFLEKTLYQFTLNNLL